MKRIFAKGPGEALMICLLLVYVGSFGSIHGQIVPRNYAVEARAQVSINPAEVRLSWVVDTNATSYKIARKDYGSSRWVPLAELNGRETSFTDRNVVVGKSYEYQLIRSTSPGYTAYGYLNAGIEVPTPEDRGQVVLIVESGVGALLTDELQLFFQDLVGDGWEVIRHDVSSKAKPPEVKQLIAQSYAQDPSRTKMVILVGRVPVPYSGNITPDEHDNHKGAWPADVYYGDVDGVWTDNSVNTTTAERSANRNVPGDGKFDQSEIPSDVELAVGRIDMYNLTCFANKTPSKTEVDLLRQYFEKNTRFRHGRIQVQERAVLFDRRGLTQPEPLSAFAYRNYAALLREPVHQVGDNQWLPAVQTNSYLFSTITAGGGYFGADHVGYSDIFAFGSFNVVFTTFCGSYYGDWDNESNFMRSSLGSAGATLTTCYGGKPQWLFFPMGLGAPIGEAVKLTQNNNPNGLYPPFNPGAGQVHISLLGDPTLRMQPIPSPPSFKGTLEGKKLRLSWEPSPSPQVRGYHLYKRSHPSGPYQRVNSALITSLNYEIPEHLEGTTYMLRAVALSESASGTYWNLSQGRFFPDFLRQQIAEQPPAAPVNLVIEQLRADRISLKWLAASQSHTGFKLERRAPGETAFREIVSLPPESRSYTDPSVALPGVYTYRLRAFNSAGLSLPSNEVNGSNTAGRIAFIGRDPSTKGNWKGVYGQEGYFVFGTPPQLPAYFSLSSSNMLTFDYGVTSDIRGLQKPEEQGRVAYCWFADTTGAIEVKLSDGLPHRVSIYFVDWNSVPRSFEIEAWDPVTNTRLDVQLVDSYNGGLWLTYDIQHHARFVMKPRSGNVTPFGIFLDAPILAAPRISPEGGIFAGKKTVTIQASPPDAEIFYTLDGTDPTRSSLRYTKALELTTSVRLKARAFRSGYPDSPISSATFINTLTTRAGFLGWDRQTQGNWPGVYGKEGFNVRLGAVQLPAYATISLQGHQEWVWSENTPDQRAPYRDTSAQRRVAAVWYAADEFSIDLSVVDIKSRAVALYFLDWDGLGRKQEVTVLDGNGSILHQETVADFRNGVYLVLNVQGHLRIRVKRLAGNNAVLNGIFFDAAPPELNQPAPVRFVNVLKAQGSLALMITGDVGSKVCVDYSDNLASWTCTGPQFIPPGGLELQAAVEQDQLFYRCHRLDPP